MAHRPVRHNHAEVRVLTALQQIRNGQQQRAIGTLRDLLQARPDFKLARFLYAQMLTSLAGGAVATGERPGAEALLVEARRRWQHYHSSPPLGAVPSAILHLAPEHDYAIVVDLPDNRLYLFRNDKTGLALVADFYVSIGSGGAGKESEGDERTPVGIYRITDFIPGERLPMIYGIGALTLNYPNAWDRHLERTGYGIWLHGVPRTTFTRPPRASEGCVVLANDNLRWLLKKVEVQATPVILTNELHWLTPAEARARLDAVVAGLVHGQRKAVVGTAELRGQSARLVPLLGGASQPSVLKRLGKWVRTASAENPLRHVSVFAYPGEPGLIMTMFTGEAMASHSPALFWRESTDRPGLQLVYARPRE